MVGVGSTRLQGCSRPIPRRAGSAWTFKCTSRQQLAWRHWVHLRRIPREQRWCRTMKRTSGIQNGLDASPIESDSRLQADEHDPATAESDRDQRATDYWRVGSLTGWSAYFGRALNELTPVERKGLALFASGLPREEIARILHCAPKTVSNRLTVAKEKLGARTLAQAVSLLLSADTHTRRNLES
jgi:DNA-binding CsgD family transcriptional regulator